MTMKGYEVFVTLANGQEKRFENVILIRNQEFPRWVDVLDAESVKNHTDRSGSIIAMIPDGSMIELFRNDDDDEIPLMPS
jgi:hypothetical protein